MDAREMAQQEKALAARPEYGRNPTQEPGGRNEAGATICLCLLVVPSQLAQAAFLLHTDHQHRSRTPHINQEYGLQANLVAFSQLRFPLPKQDACMYAYVWTHMPWQAYRSL